MFVITTNSTNKKQVKILNFKNIKTNENINQMINFDKYFVVLKNNKVFIFELLNNNLIINKTLIKTNKTIKIKSIKIQNNLLLISYLNCLTVFDFYKKSLFEINNFNDLKINATFAIKSLFIVGTTDGNLIIYNNLTNQYYTYELLKQVNITYLLLLIIIYLLKARHKTEKNAAIYSRDAPALLQIARASGKLLFDVNWKSPFVLDNQHSRNLASGYSDSIIKLAHDFVGKTLNIAEVIFLIFRIAVIIQFLVFVMLRMI